MDMQPADDEVVAEIRGGNRASFEVLMRRYNQRLYRVARAIVGDDAEAEDVMQQGYVNAYLHLEQFAERALFSTWLIRIVINEALSRVKTAGRMQRLDDLSNGTGATIDRMRSPEPDPEQRAYSSELAQVIEKAVATLPDTFRGVFVLRDIEGMSTLETAECLGLNADTVKTRLHRARALLRRELTARVGASASAAFRFHASRCDRVVAAVFAGLEAAVGHAVVQR
jgi:RNA polymerase sigma-70 factor, ECF subfamily